MDVFAKKKKKRLLNTLQGEQKVPNELTHKLRMNRKTSQGTLIS